MADARFGNWTPERVAHLTRLWQEGYTAGQSAQILGGVTRNAVIGKAHRLNLGRHRASMVRLPMPEPQPAPVPDLPAMPEIDETRITARMCRWPTATVGPNGLYICCRTVQPGRHLCAEHITAAHRIRHGINKRLNEYDTIRSRSTHATPMARRTGAA